MNDKDIILNYIENNYTFHFEEHKTYSKSNIIIGLIEKESNIFKTIENVIRDVKSLYGNFLMDNGKLIHEEITEWFEEIKNNKFKKIYDRLTELSLEQGNTNWVAIDKNGQPFDYSTLTSLDENYSKSLVKLIYDEWFYEKVIKKTEEIIGF